MREPSTPHRDPGDARFREREEMVSRQLRGRGIRDARVLEAMAAVPREIFLPEERRSLAYEDRAVPLEQGQTISQPFMVGIMSEALCLKPGDRVLEVGTGSGYQTAVLARLSREVYSVERIPSLADAARTRLSELGVDNVFVQVGDGSLGWPERAPFDAILVTAGAPEVPGSLKDQVAADGGRLVIPMGGRTLQELVRLERHGTEFRTDSLLSCRFVPLLGAEGWLD